MLWFGLKKSATSTIRWVLSLFSVAITKQEAILLTPPILRTQIFFFIRLKTFQKAYISSYFDWATLHEIFVRGEYSIDKFTQGKILFAKYFEALELGHIPLIIDAGANVGLASMYFRFMFPAAKIIAIEPSSENASKLKKNLSRISNLELHHAAIGPEDGTLSLVDPGLGNNAFRTFGPGVTFETVPQVSLNTILRENPACELLLVKVDIEGFEKYLFEANTQWIDQAHLIVLETHDWLLPGEAISQNFINSLAGKHRDLVFRGENLFSFRS